MFVDNKKEFFSSFIVKRETVEECVTEFMELKEKYGDFLTQEVYCELKGISRTALKLRLAKVRAEKAEA